MPSAAATSRVSDGAAAAATPFSRSPTEVAQRSTRMRSSL
jgi:hypothetical protein